MSKPKGKWIALRIEMIERIKAIDEATQWSEKEPEWWHDMRAVEIALLRASDERVVENSESKLLPSLQK